MKRCPEEVGDNAVKCKHCGSMLDSRGKKALDRAVTIGSGQTLFLHNILNLIVATGRKSFINRVINTNCVVMAAGE